MKNSNIQAFYARPCVRKRIAEFLGVEDRNPATCVYLAQPDLGWPRTDRIRRPDDVKQLLTNGCDLSRSLWDRQSLIAHLDMEYVNFDFHCEPYIHPIRSFQIQDPVRLTTERILSRYGIDPLHLITGRGHHYVWRVDCKSNAFSRLQHFGRCNDTLLASYHSPGLPINERVPTEHAYAFAGLGLVMEYLAGRIKVEAAACSAVPVELTAVATASGERGREMVSVDISEYGDPLHLRVIRVPFTAYRKRGAEPYSHPGPGKDVILTLAAPNGNALEQNLRAARDMESAAKLAETSSARIPNAAFGTERLIDDYTNSSLRRFHDGFYEQSQHPPGKWSFTYDLMSTDVLPPCAAHILQRPNELLLRPAAIQLVVRVLLALGWHPRHIAGLIRSKYERDYSWGDLWLIHDAATRADFYTRIFAGIFAAGFDDLADFNCASVKEKGQCLHPQDGCALDSFRQSLLERRQHDRLAHRPFNRLFLPHKHL